MKRKRKGFTVIELLAVAMIIALLAVFVVPRAFKGVGKAKRDIAKGKMAIIGQGLSRFQYDCGRLPSDAEGLDALLNPPPDLDEKWDGPYIKQSDLFDPWENEFVYYEQGTINIGSYDLICLGADGAEGGEGDNEDILND